MSRKVKVGDRLVVSGRIEKAIVERIVPEVEFNRIRIELDWGEFGKSRVYEHDEGTVWVFYDSIN